MKRVTIKAEQAGRYGLKVGNKEAIIVQNQGGMPGFLSEQGSVRGLSNEDAVRRGAAKAGLDPEECVLDYLAAIGRKGGQAGRGEAKRRGNSEHYRALAAMRPQWKPDRAITVHDDGTVSFWSVLRQVWERRPAADIGDADLGTMPEVDRAAIAAALN